MCGICGQVHHGGLTPETFAPMVDILAHRGPDGRGIHLDSTVALGQRRLSIIDIATGQQPISNEDGSVWIVFNGEIYNYQDLRPTLAAKYPFKTSGDTEVILHLYQKHGRDCVKFLRGMFAFAIWDAKQGALFLARDHLGQKPMFYAQQSQRLLFASEIKSLLEAASSLRVLDVEALHQYLTLRIIAPPRTMFKGIRKLPPGHWLWFQDGDITVERYWNPHYQPKHAYDEDEMLDALDEKVQETVRYHLVSDVPVGAFLSGGLDSSILVSMMARLSDQPFKTFSVGVPYKGTSELPAAHITAQRAGTQHYAETIVPSLVRILPDLVWHLDEPSDPLSSTMYYISRMAAQHVKVVIGGDGGDELFGGYDRYYGNHYVDYYAMLPQPLRKHVIGRVLNQMPDGFWYKSLSHKLKWVNQMSFARGGRRYARSLSYFYFNERLYAQIYTDDMRQQINGFDAEEAIYRYFDADNAEKLLDKMLFADSMVRLPDHSVMIADRTTMAHGLESRAPFMDHELVEFVARIPTDLKVRGSTLRYIQRRLGERYLAPQVLARKKQGFASGLPYLLADEFTYLFKAFLHDSHLVRDGYLRGDGLQELLSEHLALRTDHGNRLWLVCNAEIWYRMSIEGATRDDLRDQLAAFSV